MNHVLKLIIQELFKSEVYVLTRSVSEDLSESFAN